MPTMLLALLAFAPPSPSLDTTLHLPANSKIEISSLGQAIRITGTDGNELHVSGADVSADGRDVSIDGSVFGTEDGPIVVRLPHSAQVTVNAVSGSVTVIDAPDRLEITAIDGRVEVSGGDGRLNISGIGVIVVNDFAGDRLTIEGLDGGVRVAGATGVIQIENVSGPVDLTRIQSRDVRVASTDGQIRWRGNFDPAGRYRFDTHDGGVELHVPRTIDARLRLTSFDGGLITEIPATISRASAASAGWPAERRTTATWGRGRASIEITTFDGGVTVREMR